MKSYFLSLLLLLLLGFGFKAHAQVVISEILPAPASEAADAEWVEIANLLDTDIDVSGWKVNTKVIPANTVIPINGFLIISKNKAVFEQRYGVTAIQLSISLANSGGTVTLQDNTGLTLDQVMYPNADKWRDYSWERPGENMELIRHCWSSTPGTLNSNWGNPSATPVCPLIQVKTTQLDWTASAEVASEAKVQLRLLPVIGAFLHKWTWGNLASEEMQPELVAQPGEITVKVDTNFGPRTFTNNSIKLLPQLIINEVGTENGKLWVELYNPHESNVNLSGWRLTLNEQQTITLGSEANSDSKYIKLPTSFTATNLESLRLQSPNGTTIAQQELSDNLVDTQGIIEQSWHVGLLATPGATNKLLTPKKHLIISRLYPRPAQGETEYIELFNPGKEVIQLQDWYIKDSSGKHVLAGSINANDYLQVDNLKISLNNTGETITLFDGQDREITAVTYPAAGESQIWQLFDDQYDWADRHQAHPSEEVEQTENKPSTTNSYINQAEYKLVNIKPKQIGESQIVEQYQLKIWHISILGLAVLLISLLIYRYLKSGLAQYLYYQLGIKLPSWRISKQSFKPISPKAVRVNPINVVAWGGTNL